MFCFLFVVAVYVLSRKCLNCLLNFFWKNQRSKFRFEFHRKLITCLYLAILINYLTWCISIILLSDDIELNPGPKSSFKKCLSICYWNLNKISTVSYAKVFLLNANNLIHYFNILSVSETFLNSEVAASDLNLEMTGFNLYRAEHPSNCKRGGVCVFYNAKLPLKVLNISNIKECVNFEVSIANEICLFSYL